MTDSIPPPPKRKIKAFHLRRYRPGRTGFRGVTVSGDIFRAVIGSKGTSRSIGTFKTAKEAAHAYDAVARQQFGRKALLNFPMPGEQGAAPFSVSPPSVPFSTPAPAKPVTPDLPITTSSGAGDLEAFRYGEAEQLFEMCGDMQLTMLSRLFETEQGKQAFAELREQVATDFSKASFANAFCVAISATRLLARKVFLINALKNRVEELQGDHV